MRILIIAVAALVAGALIGGGITLSEFSGVEEVTTIADVEVKTTSRPEVQVVNGRTHKFGSMQLRGTKTHTFVLKNTGDKPLTLEQRDTSCMCTLSQLEAERLMPGETTNVVLTWTPKHTSENFTQTAEIGTNDPRTPLLTLRISGIVQKAIELSPSTVDLRSFTANESREAVLDVLSYYGDDLEIEKLEILPEENADLFTLQHEPAPADVVDAKGAKSGVRVKVSAKSGLPLGRIQRRIRVTYAGDKQIEADLTGEVVSDITWLASSSGFNRNANLLRIGSIPQGKGKTVKMHLVVKGPHRKDTKLEISRTDPAEALQAEIGEPREINAGKSLMYPVTLTIPKDAPPVSRLGLAEKRRAVVEIATTHPDVKQVRLLINFAVEPE